jgi:prepilin-type processing-associated H-X9-DG protein
VEAPIDEDNHGVLFLNSRVGFEEITDGSSNTIFLGEKLVDPNRDLGWMSGTRWTLRNTGTILNKLSSQPAPAWTGNVQGTDAETADGKRLHVGGFDSHHPGGANFAFGDGSVHFLSQTLDIQVYQQYGHRADGRLLKEPF